MSTLGEFSKKNGFKLLLLVVLLSMIGCYHNDIEDAAEFTPILYFKKVGQSYFPYITDTPPEYIDGGYRALLEKIYANIEYPESAMANKTEGLVKLYFAIKPAGTVDEVIIKEDIGDGCGTAAAEAVQKALEGNPFKQTDEIINVYGLIEVYFKLP